MSAYSLVTLVWGRAVVAGREPRSVSSRTARGFRRPQRAAARGRDPRITIPYRFRAEKGLRARLSRGHKGDRRRTSGTMWPKNERPGTGRHLFGT